MISIVIPMYNEEALIEELCRRTISAMETIGQDFELIFVDDGSSDRTLEKLLDQRTSDPRIKVLELSRNFGHQAAILAGLSHARGDYVGIMDGDLQDPPELFASFFAELQTGYDVVYAVRQKRKEGVFKRIAYWLYYRLLLAISNMHIPVDSGDFCLMRRQVVEQMLKTSEQSLFLRGSRHWVGFRQKGLPYERESRFAGKPKYNIRKLLQLAYNGIFSFSHFPIKLLGRIGLVTVIFSLLYAVYLISKRFFWGEVPEGYTTLILVIFFFGGVQLISIRILGEYVQRIYDESRARPLFIVRNAYTD